MNTFRLTIMICVFVVGILFPTTSYSSDYLLFFYFIETDIAWASDLDTSGELTLRKEYTVGWYPNDVSVTPNGRLVIIAGDTEPYLSCFFINKDGSIDDPIYYNYFGDIGFKRIVYHPYLPIGYIGPYPRCEKFTIDYQMKTISPTTDTMEIRIQHTRIGYSKWSNCLVFKDSKELFNRCIRTRNILLDGSISSTSHTLDLSPSSCNMDLAVSPDGHWAVTLGSDQPAMSVVGINRDGSLYLIQELSFDVFKEARNPGLIYFTPNGLYLLMLCQDTPNCILTFFVDQFTGRITLMDKYPFKSYPIPLGSAGGSAITPDGKYFLFTNGGVPGYPLDEEWYDIFRIEGNGKLTWLPDKKKVVKYRSSADKKFVPPWREGYAPTLGWLAH